MSDPHGYNFRSRPWSKDMDQALLRAMRDGLTATQAGERLASLYNRNVTRNACIGRASRLGLRWKRGPHGRLQG